jgi:hypothetical protein
MAGLFEPFSAYEADFMTGAAVDPETISSKKPLI